MNGEDDGPIRPPDGVEVARRLLMGYLDLAISGTLELGRYQRLYVDPWVEEEDSARWLGRHWYRGVFHRPPFGSEERWGRLWITFVPQPPATPSPATEKEALAKSPPLPEGKYRLRARWPEFELEMAADDRRFAPSLQQFGWEIAERFRRQMD